MNEAKWYLRTQDETFGPETRQKLIEWAKFGRIQPGQEVSDDNIVWRRVEEVPFLDMRFSIDIGDGNPRGPFNRAAAEALLASGRLPQTSTIVETREPFPSEAEAAEPEVESVVADETPKVEPEPEARVAERIVEKEVVVEKVVEKIVIDETRVKELEGLLEEERRHTAQLQARLDESAKNASEAARAAAERESARNAESAAAGEREARLAAALKDADARERKYIEQVNHLEDELRRLPQAASEVADIQAAVYSMMTSESEELGTLIEREKREFETLKRLHAERTDRLLERRRMMLKRCGANIEDMTRKALLQRPEDPRTAQLRKDFDEMRRTRDRERLDYETRLRDLGETLRRVQAESARRAENAKDAAQMLDEIQTLREQLQVREKELLAERERNMELNRQQAVNQQTMLARLAALESPSIGTTSTMATNQSREAKQVKLPGWMRFK